MRFLIILALGIAAVTAVPTRSSRILGGWETTINNYPSMAAQLTARDGGNFRHNCGATILNNRSFLSAAHCFGSDPVPTSRVRVGSTWSNSGGTVIILSRIIIHPNYSTATLDSDIAVLQAANIFSFTNVVQAGTFAGSNYNVADNEIVWAAGWGSTGGSVWSEILKHAELVIHNQVRCNIQFWGQVTANMLCVVGREAGNSQCVGDSGGPLYHRGVIIGVTSFGSFVCGESPTVNVRVSRFIDWIRANAE